MIGVSKIEHQWLPPVPASWQVYPAWGLFAEGTEAYRSSDPHLVPSRLHGVVTQETYTELTGLRTMSNEVAALVMKHVEPDNFVISMGSFESGIEHSPVAGKVSNDYRVLKPTTLAVPGYFRWFFKSRVLIDGLAGLTNEIRVGQRIHYSKFSTLWLPIPPQDVQQRIADYLDRETSEIDAMFGKLDDLAQQLVIRRNHSIEEVLRPESRSCRPTPLFALASSEDNRRIPLKAEDRSKIPGAYPYYGASGVIDNIESFIWDNETRLLVSEDGANLVARRHPIAFVASGQYWVNNHAHVLRPHDAVDPRLVAYAIAITDINHAITGSAQPKLTADALWRLTIPFPVDLTTSASIADHLDEVTGKIDAMLAKVAELKSLLIERRAALITDVVTGKKEIV